MQLEDLNIPATIPARILGQIDTLECGTQVPIAVSCPDHLVLSPTQRKTVSDICHEKLAARTISLRPSFAKVGFRELGPHHTCRRRAEETSTDISMNNSPENRGRLHVLRLMYPGSSIRRVRKIKLWVSWAYHVAGAFDIQPPWSANFDVNPILARWTHEIDSSMPASARQVADANVKLAMFIDLDIGAPLPSGDNSGSGVNDRLTCVHDMEEAASVGDLGRQDLGPVGSGFGFPTSGICDQQRVWVLGQQARKLMKSRRMSDMICC